MGAREKEIDGGGGEKGRGRERKEEKKKKNRGRRFYIYGRECRGTEGREGGDGKGGVEEEEGPWLPGYNWNALGRYTPTTFP